MLFKKILILIVTVLFGLGGATYSQGDESQKAQELDEFEKNLDSKISLINNRLGTYSSLLNMDVTHTPFQSKFRKGNGYIEMEKYDFIYEPGSSKTVIGGKLKTMRLYYSGTTFSKIESTIIEENYLLRSRKLFKVVDPSPATDDTSDIEVFKQVDKEKPLEFKLSEVDNTVSNPNRILFKKEFYVEFLNNLEEDLRYTRKYVDFYGTNNHAVTFEELKQGVDY
jgi:hypothetical protein